jgi:hypothetical protein
MTLPYFSHSINMDLAPIVYRDWEHTAQLLKGLCINLIGLP